MRQDVESDFSRMQGTIGSEKGRKWTETMNKTIEQKQTNKENGRTEGRNVSNGWKEQTKMTSNELKDLSGSNKQKRRTEVKNGSDNQKQ